MVDYGHLELGSLADLIAAGATVVALITAFISYIRSLRVRARDQAARIFIRGLVGLDGGRRRLQIELHNSSDSVIFDPVVEFSTPFRPSFRKRQPNLFDMLDARVEHSWPIAVDGVGGEPSQRPIRQIPAGESVVVNLLDVPDPKAAQFVVHFLDARQRAWRYQISNNTLHRARRSSHPAFLSIGDYREALDFIPM